MADEVVTYEETLRRVKAMCYERLADAGVPREYTDQLMTAFVYSEGVGFSYLQVQAFYEASVPPEYANAFIDAAYRVTVDEAIALFKAGADARVGVVGVRKGLSTADILRFSAVGVSPEYLDAMFPDLPVRRDS